ncbi:MAG: phosphoglucosamine mutase [Nitrososphaerota archaeon]|jgi:phosphomannomutase/phosphoglucomutase|nr:phosphoglucosamine mutase [Nitrososphaerota archaeon]
MSTTKLFGTNGIRGLVNIELTPEMAIKIGAAIGTFFGQEKNLLLGFDARTSGPMFAKAVSSGLNAVGCNVYLAGLASTPALQFGVKNHTLDGGIIISASHNPPEYNGIKVIWCDGIETSHEQETEIENIYFNNKINYVLWNQIGKKYSLLNINEEYKNAVKKHANVQKIASKHYHVVIDAANSVGGIACPPLLRELGCKVTTINANIDGTFPGRLPEPRPESLTVLSKTVQAIGADIGVAFDGDADRSIFCDNNGTIYWGDKTFAVVIKAYLHKNPGAKIVTPVSSSTLIKDTVETNKGELIWTKVGSVTVSQTMKTEDANLGGEENGGIFYRPHQAVRDGAMTTVLLLNIMADTNKSLAQLIAEAPHYFIEKGKIPCPDNKKTALQQKIYEQLKTENISTIDGIKIWFTDGSALLIRPSGTEPVFRLYAEAKDAAKASKLIEQYSAKLTQILLTL